MRTRTSLIRSGRDTAPSTGAVNPPLVRTSTVLYPDTATMRDVRARRDRGERLFSYGARGTPTTFALEDSLCELEGGERAFVYPTGLAAIAAVLLTFLRPGDHVAIVDTVYPPVRNLCSSYFSARGVEVSFFGPSTAQLSAAMRPNTRLIAAESPGSATFEVLDLPAMAAVAKEHGALLAVDNTWSAGYFHQPLALGADISIQAATKYICGHSDVMLGAVIAKGDVCGELLATSTSFGFCASPDDCYLALRGIRSLAPRLKQHEATALELAGWLAGRPEVATVLHPAMPSHPGHEFWRRDFSGASGLFSFRLRPEFAARSEQFVDALNLFGIGSSWGGYESLALSVSLASIRSAAPQGGTEPVIRLHAGLEDPADLLADLESAFSVVTGGA